MEMDYKDCLVKVDKFVEKYIWIVFEKQFFGKGGIDYDFEFCNLYVVREKFDKFQLDQLRYV